MAGVSTAQGKRHKHSPPAAIPSPEVLAGVRESEALLAAPPIPGPKPWTDELERAAVAGCLGSCNPLVSLASLGIGRSTAGEWLSEDPPAKYRSACLALAGRLKSAQDASERMLLGRIQAASADPKHWTAAAWILERSRGYVVRQAAGEGPNIVVHIGTVSIQGDRGRDPLREVVEGEVVQAQIPASIPDPDPIP